MMRERGGGESRAIPRGLWYLRDSSLGAPDLGYLGMAGSEGAPRRRPGVGRDVRIRRLMELGKEESVRGQGAGIRAWSWSTGRGRGRALPRPARRTGLRADGSRGREGEWLWPLNATREGRGVVLGNWVPWGTSRVCRTRLTEAVGGRSWGQHWALGRSYPRFLLPSLARLRCPSRSQPHLRAPSWKDCDTLPLAARQPLTPTRALPT